MGNENSGRKSADELTKQTKRILHEAGLLGAQTIAKCLKSKSRKNLIPVSRLMSAEFAINHSIGKPTQRIYQVEGRMTMAEIAEKAKEFAAKGDDTPTIVLVPVKADNDEN